MPQPLRPTPASYFSWVGCAMSCRIPRNLTLVLSSRSVLKVRIISGRCRHYGGQVLATIGIIILPIASIAPSFGFSWKAGAKCLLILRGQLKRTSPRGRTARPSSSREVVDLNEPSILVQLSGLRGYHPAFRVIIRSRPLISGASTTTGGVDDPNYVRNHEVCGHG